VDELESKVAELQATVNGLTEELVETKERVRLLEESVDVDLTTGTRAVGYAPDPGTDADADAEATGADAETTPGGSADPLTESEAQTTSRSQTSDAGASDADFIDADSEDPTPSDAAAEGAAGGDGTKSDGTDGHDEAATEDDDIIVA